MRWLGRILLLLVLAALAAGGWWVTRPKPIAVELGAVDRGPLVLRVTEDGRTELPDRYRVSAPLAGHLRRIELRAGDPVRSGDPVAWIEPAPSPLHDARTLHVLRAQLTARDAAVARAEAQVAGARATEAYASRELERARALRAGRHVPEETLDLAQRNATAAQAEVRAGTALAAEARAQRDAVRAQADLAARSEAAAYDGDGPAADAAPQRVAVPAPIDGVVLRVPDASARLVPLGAPLLEVGDPRTIEVVVDLLTRDAARLQPRAPAEVTRWGGPMPLRAHVRRVEPAGFSKVSALGVEEQRVLVHLALDTPVVERPQLGEGYGVDVHITLWESPDVLRVPVGALVRQEDAWAVYRVETGNKVRLRPITVGHRNDTFAEVLGGLARGDRVVLYATDAVKDGAWVRAREIYRGAKERGGGAGASSSTAEAAGAPRR